MGEGKLGRISRHFKETLRHLDHAQRKSVLSDLVAWAAPRAAPRRLGTWERMRFKRWLWWLYGPECAYCQRSYDIRHALTIDHIQPISKGGAVRDIRNMALACRECNLSKGNKWEE